MFNLWKERKGTFFAVLFLCGLAIYLLISKHNPTGCLFSFIVAYLFGMNARTEILKKRIEALEKKGEGPKA